MTALYIILAIVLFFALILSLRVQLYIRQTDELRLRAGVGPVVITLSPKKEKKIKLSDFTPKKHAKRLLKDKKKAEKKAAKTTLKSEKKKQNALSAEVKKAEDAAHGDAASKISGVIEIIKFIFEEFPRLASYLRTEIKMLSITVGGKDAADCAKKYGAICALTSCLIELLDNKTVLKKMRQDAVSVNADFLSEKTKIQIDVSLKISIFSIFRVGLHTLKWLISQKVKKSNIN